MNRPGSSGPIRVVVTGGGTIAPIDDVRSIVNDSSGLFAARICEAWLRRGARVSHVLMPGAMTPFHRSAHCDLGTDDFGAELDRLDRLRRRWRAVVDRYRPIPIVSGTPKSYEVRLEGTLRRERPDVVMLAAAVSDFEPEPVPGKIDSDQDELILRCRRTPKVIRRVRDWTPEAYLVGFKLLSGASETTLIADAEAACRVNRVDLTVANDLRLYREGRQTIHLVRPGEPVETYGPGIGDLAERLVDRVVEWSRGR